MQGSASNRYCGDRVVSAGAGGSSTAEAFGASVDVAVSGRSLFLVVGRAHAPDAAVALAGGSVVTRFPDGRRVLAVAPLASYAALLGHPEVSLAGPVNVDPQRFASFAALAGLDGGRARPP